MKTNFTREEQFGRKHYSESTFCKRKNFYEKQLESWMYDFPSIYKIERKTTSHYSTVDLQR